MPKPKYRTKANSKSKSRHVYGGDQANHGESEPSSLSRKRGSDEEFEEDQDASEIASLCAGELDRLLSAQYEFVDVEEEENSDKQLIPERCIVDQGINLYLPSSTSTQQHPNNKQMKGGCWKPKAKFSEKITDADLKDIAVSGEWVLNKKGVYLTGRQRRSELITGAVHSPALKSSLH